MVDGIPEVWALVIKRRQREISLPLKLTVNENSYVGMIKGIRYQQKKKQQKKNRNYEWGRYMFCSEPTDFRKAQQALSIP